MLLSTLYTKCCWAIEKNNMEFMTFGIGKKKKKTLRDFQIQIHHLTINNNG